VRFDVTTPCKECPFRRRGRHAVRLTANRVRDVAGNMLDRDGASFSCHKAAHGEKGDDADGYCPSQRDIHCVGALIFAVRNKNQTFAMQIAERLGLFDPDQFRSTKQRRLVFATIEEMLKTALPGRR
jgi:hypothetical protein